MKRVLVACEESQEVCKAFRERGFEAYSCDIQECSGGHPEWHIKDDVLKHLDEDWDLIIAHPPCTYLSTAATQCHSLKCFPIDYINDRTMKRIDAMLFFMRFVYCNCDHVAIENPQGVMNTCYRKPDQIIQPYYFCDDVNSIDYATKKTGLWLKNLPLLVYDIKFNNPMDNAPKWSTGKKKNWTEAHHGQVLRSKTFPGIAKAMAQQWGDYLLKEVTE